MELSSRNQPMFPLAQEQVDAILSRSAGGEGVANVLREMGFPVYEALEYLLEKHNDEVKLAKQRQRGEPI